MSFQIILLMIFDLNKITRRRFYCKRMKLTIKSECFTRSVITWLKSKETEQDVENSFTHKCIEEQKDG